MAKKAVRYSQLKYEDYSPIRSKRWYTNKPAHLEHEWLNLFSGCARLIKSSCDSLFEKILRSGLRKKLGVKSRLFAIIRRTAPSLGKIPARFFAFRHKEKLIAGVLLFALLPQPKAAAVYYDPIVQRTPDIALKQAIAQTKLKEQAPLKEMPVPVAQWLIPTPIIAGNSYQAGQCTWHVKKLKPSLPNNLGNADTWYSRAQAQGMATGLTPRVGAAAQVKGAMHVVYVAAVLGNGTILISEMNYAYIPFQVRVVVASASDFYYIY